MSITIHVSTRTTKNGKTQTTFSTSDDFDSRYPVRTTRPCEFGIIGFGSMGDEADHWQSLGLTRDERTAQKQVDYMTKYGWTKVRAVRLSDYAK